MNYQTCTFVKSNLPYPFVLMHWTDKDNLELISTIAKYKDKNEFVSCMEIDRDKEDIMMREFWQSEYVEEIFGDKYHADKPVSPTNTSLLELQKYFK